MVFSNKIILSIFSCIIYLNNADGSSFKLYVHDQCTDSIKMTKFYYFKRNDKIFKVDSQSGICTLPIKGFYQLYYLNNDYPLTYNYMGQAADTLNYPKLIYGFPTTMDSKENSGYVICGVKIANGKLRDYFKDNKKRIEGMFVNGKLIGKLIYYDLDGKIVKIEYGAKNKKRHKRKK